MLVETAPKRIRELENELGCFFDRNPDGTVHQKAFAGQTFDRTVHKGDLTGIEIINRLAEQVWRRDVRRLEDHRALDLIPARRRLRARRRADARHAHGRAAAGARARDAAGDRRRPDHVPLPHAVGRQILRRPGDGAARRPAAARHGDGAVPSDRPAGRRRHAHDRHRAGRRPARLRRLSAPTPQASASCSTTMRAASAPRATSSAARSWTASARASPRPHGGVYIEMGASRPRARAARVQGHGRALRRLRLRSRRRPRRGDPDRALHDGRRRVQGRLHDRTAAASTRPARIPAACTAPIAWAATASPTRRCSAASPAT